MRREARTAAHSLQRAALLALFAFASFAVLPYLHALSSNCGAGAASCSPDQPPPSHSPDCGVCGSLAHAGARAVDVPIAVVALPLPLARPSAPQMRERLAPARERAASPARGPPALPSHA